MHKDPNLPPSLAVSPNIPYRNQTRSQLLAERIYWQSKLSLITHWGAAECALHKFLAAIDAELQRRPPL